MLYYFIMILLGYAVRCDDSSYYVIEMQEAETTNGIRTSKQFQVYWNVPTMQCTSKKIPFENLYQKYGIIQNEKDQFRGEKLAILYDPGIFPALLKNDSGELVFRNGGVPQEGDLERHLVRFAKVMEESVLKDFSGIGIIDFESWRPIYRQNFGVLTPYKEVSYEIERAKHWWWTNAWLQEEATRRFEKAAKEFMHKTLILAKQLRPNAKWGYYAYPYCFNMAGKHMSENCADRVPEENDRISWLWSESTALYPSVYSSKKFYPQQLQQMIRGRIKEAQRQNIKNSPILPYFWFRYRDGGMMNKNDLKTALETMYKSSAAGFIIWGSSNDVNTKDKCLNLLNYLNDTLGPAIAQYTKRNRVDIQDDTANADNYETILNDTTKPNFTEPIPDPELDWDPPENYTLHIAQSVQNEIERNSYGIKNNNSRNESSILDRRKIENNQYHPLDSYINNSTSEKLNMSSILEQINITTVADEIANSNKNHSYLSKENINCTSFNGAKSPDICNTLPNTSTRTVLEDTEAQLNYIGNDKIETEESSLIYTTEISSQNIEIAPSSTDSMLSFSTIGENASTNLLSSSNKNGSQIDFVVNRTDYETINENKIFRKDEKKGKASSIAMSVVDILSYDENGIQQLKTYIDETLENEMLPKTDTSLETDMTLISTTEKYVIHNLRHSKNKKKGRSRNTKHQIMQKPIFENENEGFTSSNSDVTAESTTDNLPKDVSIELRKTYQTREPKISEKDNKSISLNMEEDESYESYEPQNYIRSDLEQSSSSENFTDYYLNNDQVINYEVIQE